MPVMSPKDDTVMVWNSATGAPGEATMKEFIKACIMQGSGVTLSTDAGTGRLRIDLSGGGGGDPFSVAHDTTMTGTGLGDGPLSVVQATEAQRGAAQIITQSELNASTAAGGNDTDILTAKKLLNISGAAKADLKTALDIVPAVGLTVANITSGGIGSIRLTLYDLGSGLTVGSVDGGSYGQGAGTWSCLGAFALASIIGDYRYIALWIRIA